MPGDRLQDLPSTISTESLFQRAWAFGQQSGLFSAEVSARILADGAKGIVQIAGYFGTAHLQPELEMAAQRLDNLLSLHLEREAEGSVAEAARLLATASLLPMSKAAADLLRQLFALPAPDESLYAPPALGEAAQAFDMATYLMPFRLADYRAELERRTRSQHLQAFASLLLADIRGARQDAAGVALDSIFNTVFLSWCGNQTPAKIPSALQLFGIAKKILPLKPATLERRLAARIADLPATFRDAAAREQARFQKQVLERLAALLADAGVWQRDSLFFTQGDLDEDSRIGSLLSSAEWKAATKGDTSQEAAAAVFFLVASNLSPKPSLLKADFRRIADAYRLGTFNPSRVADFIGQYAPDGQREELLSLWTEDLLPDAEEHLGDPLPGAPLYKDAEAFLQANCRTSAARAKHPRQR